MAGTAQSTTNRQIADKILEILSERNEGITICPSEVARALEKHDWRDLMDRVRTVADDLREKKKIQITQRGKPIPSAVEAHGPIRLRLTK